jgi:hypothetical protein
MLSMPKNNLRGVVGGRFEPYLCEGCGKTTRPRHAAVKPQVSVPGPNRATLTCEHCGWEMIQILVTEEQFKRMGLKLSEESLVRLGLRLPN